MNDFLEAILPVLQQLSNKAIWLGSMLFSLFLHAIGFPKEVVLFVFGITILDLITKHTSIVIKNFGKLTFENYYIAWKLKVLTSHNLKVGFAGKCLLYIPLLVVANQVICISELQPLGNILGNTIYMALTMIELSSIFENYRDVGYTKETDYIKRLYESKIKDVIEPFEGNEEKENTTK